MTLFEGLIRAFNEGCSFVWLVHSRTGEMRTMSIEEYEALDVDPTWLVRLTRRCAESLSKAIRRRN